MGNDEELANLLFLTAAQASIYDKRAKSRIEKQYGDAMQRSAIALMEFTRNATFDQLILLEKTFQRNDLAVYAQLPSTMKSVQQGIDDLENGEGVYKQLLNNPQAYSEHKYRDSERAGPGKLVPLDAMRRALRGQVKRIENYRKNVMSNPQEQKFMSTRIVMLRRAEKLYDALQREQLARGQDLPKTF